MSYKRFFFLSEKIVLLLLSERKGKVMLLKNDIFMKLIMKYMLKMGRKYGYLFT